MSNKNPFEIRAEMLSMAKDYMDAAWKLNIEYVQSLMKENKATYEDLYDAMKPYSIDELTNKAKELYTFVSTKE